MSPAGSANPSGSDTEEGHAAPAAPPGYEPEDGQQQQYAFGNWCANVRSAWRQATSGATPVAATSHLAMNWLTDALYTQAPDVYFLDPDWPNDAGIACIPAGPDGLDQLC